ncbi:MAG: carboxypeptidase regulatory-like domain-containing protein [Planctomycetes bacterium]|nr:carboxypeptidase regulatory-like domain-containing protein [Planctomycetota bacterium]
MAWAVPWRGCLDHLARYYGFFNMRYFAFLFLAVDVVGQTPPPLLGDHLEPASALSREFVHHARVGGTVVDAGGAPAVGASVVVYGYQPWYSALPLASATTDAKGNWTCSVSGGGRTYVWATSAPDAPFAAAHAPVTLCSGTTTAMLPLVLEAPTGDKPTITTVRGHVLAKDGTPIADALVRLQHENTFDPTAYTTTGTDGSFAIGTRLGQPKGAGVFFANYRVVIEHTPDAKKLRGSVIARELDLAVPCLVQDDSFAAHALPTVGVEGARYATVVGGVAAPCSTKKVCSIDPAFGGSSGVSVLGTAPGWLPQIRYLPTEAFTFGTGEERSLVVVDDRGQPLTDALVDICGSGPRFEETTLQTLRSDRDGKVTLRGEEKANHVVYAYAEGHDPARGEWTRSTTPLRLACKRRSGTLAATIPTGARSLFVRRAGMFDPAAIHYATEGEVRIPLAPGDYEATCYGTDGVLAMDVVTITAGETSTADLARDRRPLVRVRVPKAIAGGDTWWAFGSRETQGGMITKWSIHTQRGGPMPRRALAAEVTEVAAAPDQDREFAVRLPITGRHTLLLGSDKRAERFFREIVAAAGGDYTIELPGATVTASATATDYPKLWGEDFAVHGIVGPRLCLEPEGDTAFGLMVPLPTPAKFTVPVPAPGRYAVHHHLYKTGILTSSKGITGGTVVTVAAGTDATLGELSLGTGNEVEIRILDGNGAPATGTLAVRDRMFEAWTFDLQQNTTLDDAMDPIPTPPQARLADGTAKLPRLRTGRVPFVLELDDGRRVFFTREVKSGELLEVKLAFPLR